MKLLTHRGYLIEEQRMVCLAETEAHAVMALLQSIPNFDAQHTQRRCVSEQVFSLHAEVRCAMNQRKNLE